MPCTVDPIYVNFYKENKELLEMANKATVMLDRAREDILAGRTPNLVFYIQMFKFDQERRRLSRNTGPFSGTPLDFNLEDHFKGLMIEVEGYVTGNVEPEVILARQILHRKEDVKRLRLTFTESGDDEMLAKTLNIDYTLPLEPQLGFDPDSY